MNNTMRKSILIFSLIVVTIVIVTFCAREDRYSTNMLLLENVEALAYGEIEGPVHCLGSGTVDCPHTFRKVKYVMEGYSLEDLY